ncbi:MAG: carboxypeptidase-like regulatory domain-containing protein [Bacteroidota bacterium]
MSNYLLELAVIHGVLGLGYYVLLRKERQYGMLRWYWIVATVLAISIPLLKLPQLVQPDTFVSTLVVQEPAVTEVAMEEPEVGAPPVEAPPVGLAPKPTKLSETEAGARFDPWRMITLLYCLVSALLFIKVLVNLAKLIQLRQQSQVEQVGTVKLRRTQSVEGSFSFFGAVFLGKDLDPQRPDGEMILKHEQAHVALGHTYDLLFFELFKVAFWWLPTAWFVSREIRRLHEYQADAHVLKTCAFEQYSQTLIKSTLAQQGVGLASSFHSNFILKRLQVMQQQVKRIRPWKVGALTSVGFLLIFLLAFTEERALAQPSNAGTATTDTTFSVIEEPPMPLESMESFWAYIDQNFNLVSSARQSSVRGLVWVEFDVEADGTVGNVGVSKGEGTEFEAEVQAAMKHMPAFRPGKQRGKSVPVSMKMELQITYRSEEADGGTMIMAPMEINAQFLNINADFSKGTWEGTVYDKERRPLAGVSISIPDSNLGTVSDQNGQFRMEADASQLLLASYVGYKPTWLKAE